VPASDARTQGKEVTTVKYEKPMIQTIVAAEASIQGSGKFDELMDSHQPTNPAYEADE
jgi:hypothetical protein